MRTARLNGQGGSGRPACSLMLAALLWAAPVLAAMPPVPAPKPPVPAAAPDAAATGDPQQVLAQVGDLRLTRADADAYVDALVFSLEHAGQDSRRLAADRTVVREHLARSFPGLPEAAQIDLADMTEIWERVQAGWAALGPAERNAFSYGVLALAFGEQDAGRILRWNPRGTMVPGEAQDRPLPGYAPGQEMDCIMTGNCGPSGSRLPE
ncbi:MAG TPA: hypothetical protein VNS22_12040 [Geminicoccus sp.]|uniref:hypothetical protein n=1 Tax=Geminicoccus sp. TaxID=2024832 RepID=UPI002C2F2FEA|nr:hypothetical protein [Geminicoccus sp.]HWL69101.1 hypothetical protein [Geminicoccus sp.]